MNSTNSIALIVLATGIFFFFTKPELALLSDTLSKKQEYQDALVKINSIEQIKSGLSDKLNSLSDSDKSEIQTLLQDSLGQVRLVSDIASVASKNAISIGDISFASVNDDSASSVSGAAPSKDYKSSLVSFSFTSDYAHLKSFLTDLESSMRLIDVRNIDIASNQKGVYSYKISAEVYYLQ